jgi:hypothetical protein
MRLNKGKPILLFIACILAQTVFSQTRVSASTNFLLIRSFKEDQRFWAVGQDILFDWHFTTKGGAYASLTYSSYGNFTNQLSASAKDSTTSPQEISFTNKSQLRFQEISFGFKHYFVGTTDAEYSWSLYSLTGFGLMFGSVRNAYSTTIDTSLYNAPQQPVNGSGHFKRLTLDLGLGWEVPMSGNIYFYISGKLLIPTSDYPSKYLFVNDSAPIIGTLGLGIRVLF